MEVVTRNCAGHHQPLPPFYFLYTAKMCRTLVNTQMVVVSDVGWWDDKKGGFTRDFKGVSSDWMDR